MKGTSNIFKVFLDVPTTKDSVIKKYEYEGDAILEKTLRSLSLPHDTKQMFCSNNYLSYLVVKNGLHHLMKISFPIQFKKVVEYSRFVYCPQFKKDYPFGFILKPPKLLADKFESLIYVIYSELGEHESTRFILRIFEFEKFSNNVPISAREELNKIYKSSLDYSFIQPKPEIFVGNFCILKIKETGVYLGSGSCRKSAEKSASQNALRTLNPIKYKDTTFYY